MAIMAIMGGWAYLLTFTFLEIFVLLGPGPRSGLEEMLGSSEEALPEGFVLDSGVPS